MSAHLPHAKAARLTVHLREQLRRQRPRRREIYWMRVWMTAQRLEALRHWELNMAEVASTILIHPGLLTKDNRLWLPGLATTGGTACLTLEEGRPKIADNAVTLPPRALVGEILTYN